MRDRRLKWGSVVAAAQVGQSVIFSTETVQRITSGRLQAAWVNTQPPISLKKNKPPLENTALD